MTYSHTNCATRRAACALALASISVGFANAQQTLRISEILLDPFGSNPGNQVIEIQNVSGQDFTQPSFWTFCVRRLAFPGYPVLPSITIPAGGVVKVHIGATGTDTATDWYLPGIPLLLDDDEFSIYKTTADPVTDPGGAIAQWTDPNFVEDFVSWGQGAGILTTRINEAVGAGLWPSPTSHVAPVPAEGNTLAWMEYGMGPVVWHEDPTPTLGLPNGPMKPLRISEILIDPVGSNVGTQIVELQNVSGYDFIQPAFWTLCMRRGGTPGYPVLPSITIPAGGVVQVHVGASGTNTATDWYFPNLPMLNPDDEIALYSTTEDPAANPAGALAQWADPHYVQDFVSWGNGPGALFSRSAEAVAAGVWPSATTHLANPPEGSSLAWQEFGQGAQAWYEASTPTLGAPNDPDVRPLRISEILEDPTGSNVGTQIVEVQNVSGQEFLQPAAWTLCMRRGGAIPGYPELPSITIPAGGIVQLHIAASGTNTATDWYFPDLPMLNPDDELAIYSTTAGNGTTAQLLQFSDRLYMEDFVSWGNGPGAAFSRIATAVSAGLWPSSTSHLTPAAEGSTMAWFEEGTGPSAWYEDSTPTLGAPNAPAKYVPFAAGCPGSAGVPDLHAATPSERPWLGGTFTVEVTNVPFATLGVLYMGLLEFPAPGIPLVAVGMGPTCFGYPSQDVSFILFSTGSMVSTLSLPLTPTFEGLVWVNQCVVLDPAAGNPLGAVISNPARATVGLR
ncbi:MAG: hypothetical protein VYE77_05835 [Planctomycetota bacterium]|nr:hypothetical protein [Planctomycetota bacterium]